jgi:hypothetical protein
VIRAHFGLSHRDEVLFGNWQVLQQPFALALKSCPVWNDDGALALTFAVEGGARERR